MRHATILALGLTLLTAAACGGGGGNDPSPGPAPDLTGWWLESFDDVDDPLGYAPYRLLELVDDGATVLYEGRSLLKQGWTLRLDRPDAIDPDRQTWRFAIRNAQLLEGRIEKYDDDVRDWAHLHRLTPSTPPDGTLVLGGSIEGHEVAVDASRAYAVEYDDGGIWTSLFIEDPDAATYTYVWITYEITPHIPVGAYDVGPGNDEMSFLVRTEYRYGDGASGTVVLTHSSDTRAAGWYIVTLDDGSSVSGSFDVPIRIATPWRR